MPDFQPDVGGHISCEKAKIGVVIATYNRSNVLRYAIESVLRQTLQAWELLVVGDACTDDTAAVVAAFCDPRIRFVNLERNCGEQSGPNNWGVAQLKTEFVAYLNHDDFYFDDHLSTAMNTLALAEADLVYSALICPLPTSDSQTCAGSNKFFLQGASSGDIYDPVLFVPASSWVLRRSLVSELGGWKSAHDCGMEPSHDFLFRAWRAGKKLASTGAVTVFCVPSGARESTYAKRASHEHDTYWHRMRSEPKFRETAITCAAFSLGGELIAANRRASSALLTRCKRWLFYAMCKLGYHPKDVRMRIKFGPGGLVRALRRRRGLTEDF
ncbi:MAG: glycosyltransferase family 2 protein [Burkholderiales bacterium]|nr:MAG: glycosyltransferase family 2 protein [Burkholderiales bacterium]TAG84060.1 MAG: glycosyltransferase family 2 protein [Betaproteobacteria bacterium]